MNISKCALGVAWTSALIAIAISAVIFSIFNIGDVIESLGLGLQQNNFVIKIFAFMVIFIWLILWASFVLNCFYRSLRNSSCGCEP